MPPAITGPGPLMEPPLPATPFTVSYSRAVLYSHSTFPSTVEYARIMPSVVPENTTPGITLSAADRDATHARGLADVQLATCDGCDIHACRPSVSDSANSPPAASAPNCASA